MMRCRMDFIFWKGWTEIFLHEKGIQGFLPPQGFRPEGEIARTPELLIDLIYIFCYIFFIRTKSKRHVFTTFMNVSLSLLREG